MNEENFVIELKPFIESHLELTYKWLRDPEIKAMTASAEFSKFEQKKWFDSLPAKLDYKIHIVTMNDLPIGVCGIKNIEENSGEYWGYIGEKENWGKGIGKIILREIEKKARELNLASLYLFVKNLENHRAINLYHSCGYKVIEETESFIKMDKLI